MMSTVAPVGAARTISWRSRSIGALRPTSTDSSSSAVRSLSFSARSWLRESAFAIETRIRSRCGGFSRKSTAPRRVASTAVAMSPCPEIMRTGGADSRATILSRTSSPSMPGILMSRRTASAGALSRSASAVFPSGEVATS